MYVGLKCLWRICQTKRYDYIFEMIILCLESGLPPIGFFDYDLVVCFTKINL